MDLTGITHTVAIEVEEEVLPISRRIHNYILMTRQNYIVGLQYENHYKFSSLQRKIILPFAVGKTRRQDSPKECGLPHESKLS